MAGSSNYFSHSDDEENPFINRGNNDRNLKNKNNNTDNNYINNNKKNKRYVQNDISSDIENSSLITTQDRKRLKINGQYETSIYEKEVPSKNNNNKGIHNIEDISNNSTTETETDSYVNTPSKKPMIRNSNKYNNGNDNNINDNGHNINNNEAVDRTSYIINEKEKRNIAKDKEKKKKEKNKGIETEEEIEKDGKNNKEKRINNNEDHSNEREVSVLPLPKIPTQSIRSKKLEMALDKTIAKINRLVSYKHFRQCFPTLSNNDREDMKDVHSQMTLYFTRAITDEFHIIFKKFEMDKNLLLIDECCRQGKKVTPDDLPNKPVNVIYNRVGPDTIIRSNSVNIKKKQLEDLKAYYNELYNDNSLDEWVSLNNEKKKYRESIEEYITYLTKNIEIMKKNDDY